MILHVGGDNEGALTAFDPATGEVKWSWNGDGPAYGSPIIAEIGGTRQLMRVLAAELRRRESRPTAQLLWSVPFEARSTTNSITPLVYGGNTVIVSGQGKPLTAYIVANKGGKWVADLAWENPQIRCRSATPCSWATRSSRCRRSTAASSSGPTRRRGKTLWRRSRARRATPRLRASGDLLFVLKDNGELMVGKATPGAAFTPIENLHRRHERDVGAAGHFRQSHFREGHRHAGAVDAELGGLTHVARVTSERMGDTRGTTVDETEVGSYFVANYPPFSVWTADAVERDALPALSSPAAHVYRSACICTCRSAGSAATSATSASTPTRTRRKSKSTST